MTNNQEKFLRNVAREYFLGITDCLGELGLVYDQIAILEQNHGVWLDSIEVFDSAYESGLNLMYLSRVVDHHRATWPSMQGLPSPLIGYDLATSLAESLVICKTPTSAQEAIKLPLISVPRLEELYTPALQSILLQVKPSLAANAQPVGSVALPPRT